MKDDIIEQAILKQLEHGRLKIDDIAHETGLVIYQVSAALTMLELKGLVTVSAGYFSLTAKPTHSKPSEPIKPSEPVKPAEPVKPSEPAQTQGVVLNNLPPRSDNYAPGSMLDYLSKLPR